MFVSDILGSEINVRTAVAVGSESLTTIENNNMLLLLFLISPIVSLVVYGENTVIYNHMVVDFGVPYEKNSSHVIVTVRI